MNDDAMGTNAPQNEEGAAFTPSAENASLREQARFNAEDESGMEALLRDSDYAFRSLRRGETVEGTVVRVDADEVLVDVGLKSEGVIPARELYSDPENGQDLKIGDRTLVYVMQPESSEGHAVLSLRRAQAERSWRDIEEVYNEGGIVEAPVVDFNKGGLIVDVRGIRGFVPVSQVLDLRNVSRQEGENEEVNQTLAAMNGRRLPLKVIEINRSRNRLILSERAAVQEQRTLRKDQLMDQLEAGQVRRGVVSNLTSFGAFIDLGGADGLVHVSELSYNRVNHPSEILRVGQEVDVFVLSVDRDTKKIALSLKRAQTDPWTVVDETYHVGEVVPATITKLAKFGAFAKVQEGLEGLIHTTELTDLPVQDPSQVVQEGQAVNVKIIHINSQRRRLGLSVRQASEQGVDTGAVGGATTDTALVGEPVDAYESSADFEASHQDEEHEDTSLASAFHEARLNAANAAEVQERQANTNHVESESGSTSHEVEHNAGEQDSPAAEFEPRLDGPRSEEAAAVAPEEESPASPEASLPIDEHHVPPVASAASRASSQE
ncbi:MAG: hypothetical protein NVSMB22_14210 [Chloroflexota bacterium]